MRSGAGGTRALVAQIRQGVIAVMPVAPIDLDAGGFRNGDVLGIQLCFDLHVSLRCGWHSFYIANARYPAEGADHPFELLFVPHIHSDFDDGAVVAALLIAARFERTDVARLSA